MAGIPIYSVQGVAAVGGWPGAAGPTCRGSPPKRRACSWWPARTPAATKEVRAALRKLVRALPEPLRDDAEAASAALVVDPDPWIAAALRSGSPVLLDEVQRAVVEGRQAELG
ncbi:MAG: hypothetical protein U0P45_14270 [Acidimicrobiales bacterium]